jgi:hypothetical protein
MLSQIVFLRESGAEYTAFQATKSPTRTVGLGVNGGSWGESITSTIQRFPSDFTELLNPISLGFGVHLEFQVGGSIR